MAENNQTISGEDCTLSTCGLEQAQILYVPSLAGNAAYLGLFAFLLVAQILIGTFHRIWGFLVGMVCGLTLEVVGYVGRVQMHFNPFPFDPFLMHLVCVTIGPAFISASIYLCLSRLIVVHGEHLSRLRPRTYMIVFVVCDVTSLMLQATGGALAAVAESKTMTDNATNVLVTGLGFQVFSLCLFLVLWGEYAWKVWWTPEDSRQPRFETLRSSKRFKAFQLALVGATVFILIRSSFRVADLQAGFRSEIFNNETLFMIFEGPMVISAGFLLTVFHPGIVFRGRWKDANWTFRTRAEKTDSP